MATRPTVLQEYKTPNGTTTKLNWAEGMKLNCLTIDNYNCVMLALGTLCAVSFDDDVVRMGDEVRCSDSFVSDLSVLILWTRWSVRCRSGGEERRAGAIQGSRNHAGRPDPLDRLGVKQSDATTKLS